MDMLFCDSKIKSNKKKANTHRERGDTHKFFVQNIHRVKTKKNKFVCFINYI